MRTILTTLIVIINLYHCNWAYGQSSKTNDALRENQFINQEVREGSRRRRAIASKGVNRFNPVRFEAFKKPKGPIGTKRKREKVRINRYKKPKHR